MTTDNFYHISLQHFENLWTIFGEFLSMGPTTKICERVYRRWCHCLCWRPRTAG